VGDNLSQYSRRNSDNASDVEVGSHMGMANANQSTYVNNKHHINKQKKTNPKKKYGNNKKFPEMQKMVVNGQDYRGSNYTMSSDDEVFNFPPIKKGGIG